MINNPHLDAFHKAASKPLTMINNDNENDYQ